MTSTPLKKIRIFISSPGDVKDERDRAKQLIEGMRRRYAGQLDLEPILWEQMPLQPDMPFQHGIESVLNKEESIDIAVFILWTRFGSPTGPNILDRKGLPYQSGTQREYDLMTEAKAASPDGRPDILVYTRRDDESFHERLRGESAKAIRDSSDQKVHLEKFIAETFNDSVTGTNTGAYHTFSRPVDFSHLLRAHLQELLDKVATSIPQKTIWNVATEGSPFRGLSVFQPEHAPVFFGREEEIQEACLALRESAKNGAAFLLLLGASGSGKSSLARAGVLPAVRDYELNGQVAHWRTLIVTPSVLGTDLVTGLVRRLMEPGTAEPSRPGERKPGKVLPELSSENGMFSAEMIAASLRKDAALTCLQVFGPAFERAGKLAGGPVRLLLVIDQLEELFTIQDISKKERSLFLEVIQALAETRRVWVVATARSDLYQKLQNERVLVELKKGQGQMDVLPPGADALRRLVELPAKLSGLRFEEWNVGNDKHSLSDVILKDAAAHAELLPLIEFALSRLFEERNQKDGMLQRATYQKLGGSVEGALASHADVVFSELSLPAQETLPEVLQTLVSVVRDTEVAATAKDGQNAGAGNDRVVRLHAPLEDFKKCTPQRELVDAFVNARLFTTDKHPETGMATVTVAHESLLRAWPRAIEWVRNNREFLRVRSQVDSRMKEGGLILEGDQLLLAAKAHVEQNPAGFSRAQREFITSSLSTAKALRLRRQVLLTGLISGAVIAIFSTVMYFSMQREEDALASQFIAQAERNLAIKDFARAEVAAAEALLHRDGAEGREILLKARSGGVSLVKRGSAADGGKLTMCAISRDGAVVASLQKAQGDVSTVVIEETETGRRIGTIEAQALAGEPECMELRQESSGRTSIAIARPDHSVGIWRFQENQKATAPVELKLPNEPVLGRHKKRVPSMAFHPTQPWVMTSGEDQKLCLWDLSGAVPALIWEQEPDKARDIKTHSTAIHGIAFNADGSMLGSGGGDYLVKLWKTEDLVQGYVVGAAYQPHVVKPFQTMAGHSDSVFVVAFSPDGGKLASSGYDRVIKVWDLNLKDEKNNPPVVGALTGHEGTVLDLAFTADSQMIISGGKDMTVRLWDAGEARNLVTLHPECGVIRAVACRGFGGNILCGGEEGWNAWHAGSCKVASKLWTGALVGAIAFDPKGRYVASAGSGAVHLWDAHNQPLEDLKTGNEETMNGVVFSADGRWLAAGGEDMMIHVWDVDNNWKPVTPADPKSLQHSGAIWGMCFDPMGRWLATGNTDADKRLRFWSMEDWRLLKESPPQDHSVYTLASNEDGTRLASGDSNGEVLLWDCTKAAPVVIETKVNVPDGERNVWSVAACPEPLSILSGNSNGHVYRWIPSQDPQWQAKPTGEFISISEKDAQVNHTINSVSYNGREKWVAAVGDGGGVELYDNDLKKVRSLPGHDGTIWYVTFNRQGNRLASGGGDKFMRVWDIDELKRILNTATPGELAGETRRQTGMSVNDKVIGLTAQP